MQLTVAVPHPPKEDANVASTVHLHIYANMATFLRRVRQQVQELVAEEFNAGEGLALTKPTFFSRITNKVRRWS